jgi:hypothetical protein
MFQNGEDLRAMPLIERKKRPKPALAQSQWLASTRELRWRILRHRLSLVEHLPLEVCYILLKLGELAVQFAVGFKIQGKTGHVVVDAEDALIAALKVKMQRPEALIAYVRQQNKRGDTRHPMRRLGSENA